MPRRTSSPIPARAARASTRWTARSVISSRPRLLPVGSRLSVPRSPTARRRILPTGRAQRTRSLDPTRNPEHHPASPSDAALCARRPHVNRSARRPVTWDGAGSRTTHSRLRRAHELEGPISNAGGGVARRRRIHDCSAGRRRHRRISRRQRDGHAVARRRGAHPARRQHHRRHNHRCLRPLRDPQRARGIVQCRGPLPGLPLGHAERLHRGGGRPRPRRLPPGLPPDQSVGGGGDLRRAAHRRHADRQPDLQTERLPRCAHQHDVPDPAAVHRGCRPCAHGRSPHPRSARRVHVLCGRRPSPRGSRAA